jgi:hypothetical protein
MTSHDVGSVLSDLHKKQLVELAKLAEVHIRDEVLSPILGLLALGASPSSLNTVLTAICKPPGTGLLSKRLPGLANSGK